MKTYNSLKMNFDTEKFTDYLKSKELTKKTIHTIVTAVERYWKWVDRENMEIEQVGYNDLLLFMKQQSKRGINQRTLQHYMGSVKHYFEYLKREGVIEHNPAADIEIKGVKKKTLHHILEPHELQGLYTCPNLNLKEKVALGLMVNQGLKTEELGRLTTTDINLREGKIKVGGSRKGNGRELKLEAHQMMDMYAFVMEKKESEQMMFINDQSKPQEFRGFIQRLMAKLKANSPTVASSKQIRASVIVKWLKIHNLRETQYLAGHRYISSTESYLQNDMEGLKEEVDKFHPLG